MEKEEEMMVMFFLNKLSLRGSRNLYVFSFSEKFNPASFRDVSADFYNGEGFCAKFLIIQRCSPHIFLGISDDTSLSLILTLFIIVFFLTSKKQLASGTSTTPFPKCLWLLMSKPYPFPLFLGSQSKKYLYL